MVVWTGPSPRRHLASEGSTGRLRPRPPKRLGQGSAPVAPRKLRNWASTLAMQVAVPLMPPQHCLVVVMGRQPALRSLTRRPRILALASGMRPLSPALMLARRHPETGPASALQAGSKPLSLQLRQGPALAWKMRPTSQALMLAHQLPALALAPQAGLKPRSAHLQQHPAPAWKMRRLS